MALIISQNTIVSVSNFEAARKAALTGGDFNLESPWHEVLADMVKAANEAGFSSDRLEEIAIDYLDSFSDDNEFYDHIRARYNVGAMDAQTIVDAFKPARVLRQFI